MFTDAPPTYKISEEDLEEVLKLVKSTRRMKNKHNKADRTSEALTKLWISMVGEDTYYNGVKVWEHALAAEQHDILEPLFGEASPMLWLGYGPAREWIQEEE